MTDNNKREEEIVIYSMRSINNIDNNNRLNIKIVDVDDVLSPEHFPPLCCNLLEELTLTFKYKSTHSRAGLLQEDIFSSMQNLKRLTIRGAKFDPIIPLGVESLKLIETHIILFKLPTSTHFVKTNASLLSANDNLGIGRERGRRKDENVYGEKTIVMVNSSLISHEVIANIKKLSLTNSTITAPLDLSRCTNITLEGNCSRSGGNCSHLGSDENQLVLVNNATIDNGNILNLQKMVNLETLTVGGIVPFKGLNKLTHLIIDKEIRELRDGAFDGLENIEKLTLLYYDKNGTNIKNEFSKLKKLRKLVTNSIVDMGHLIHCEEIVIDAEYLSLPFIASIASPGSSGSSGSLQKLYVVMREGVNVSSYVNILNMLPLEVIFI